MIIMCLHIIWKMQYITRLNATDNFPKNGKDAAREQER